MRKDDNLCECARGGCVADATGEPGAASHSLSAHETLGAQAPQSKSQEAKGAAVAAAARAGGGRRHAECARALGCGRGRLLSFSYHGNDYNRD